MNKNILLFLLISFQTTYSLDYYRFDEQINSLIIQLTLSEKISLLYAQNNNGVARLGIPAYNWANECLHGVVAKVATTHFPQSIGLGATWNVDLIQRITDAISDEARILSKANITGLNFWSPNINIFRDPRWGRGQETFGEDPYLTSRIAVAFVKGLQGNDSNFLKTIASPKHFAAHSGPEDGRLSFNSIVTQNDLWETYLPAFKAAVTEGKSYSIMSSYNSINGVPATVNKTLLYDILRNKWGFKGFVVSDCGAVYQVLWGHHYATSKEESVSLPLKAGVDLECGMMFQNNLVPAILTNNLTVDIIDTAVSRLLRARFMLGLFENPQNVTYNFIPDSLLNSYKHKQLAREAAVESYVLLKNNGVLPLSKNIKKILILGPTADDIFTYRGNYSSFAAYEESMLDGIRTKFRSEIIVDYDKFIYYPNIITEPLTSKNIMTDKGIPGFYAEYFDNINLEGNPIASKIDSLIDFNWGENSPIKGLPNDYFSVRWTGILSVPDSGEYTFKIANDDGSKLFINDSLILDDWYFNGNHHTVIKINLDKNTKYRIKLEYMENYGSANVSLYYGNELTGENALINIKEKAEQYDAVILTLGNSPQFENENFNINLPGFYQGDRTSIEFPTAQQRLIESLSQIKPPTILLIKSGGPISSPFAEDNIDAIVQLWYDGQEGGNATADILFGEANPSGKLPLTIYKRTTDLPEFTDYSMANRTYKYFEGEVLYPFGFGLSYTNFAYDSISISDKSVDICNDLSVNVDFKLSNIGKYDGSEVAQLYIRNVSSKRKQPIKQLKGFQKQFLRIGESKNISIKLNLKDLYYWDELINDYNYEPGLYEIQIGKSSADIMLLDTLFMDNCSTNVVHHTLNEDSFIYPNPASDNIILDLSKYNDKIHVIEIYNILGVKVRFVDNIPAESSYTFNIRELSSSTYYVKIFGQNQSYTVKFVKN